MLCNNLYLRAFSTYVLVGNNYIHAPFLFFYYLFTSRMLLFTLLLYFQFFIGLMILYFTYFLGLYSRGKGLVLRFSAVIEIMLQTFAWEEELAVATVDAVSVNRQKLTRLKMVRLETVVMVLTRTLVAMVLMKTLVGIVVMTLQVFAGGLCIFFN